MNDRDDRPRIIFGPLVATIATQLDLQGFTAPPESVAAWQQCANAIEKLRLHGVLSDEEVERARRRITGMIWRGAKRKP